MRLWLLSAFILFVGGNLLGQTDSTAPALDTTKVVPPTTIQPNEEASKQASVVEEEPKWTPDPKRAALLSAVLPGAGQIYNRKYWKLPIVYGVIGAMGYLYFSNRYWYLEYREAYLNDLEDINPPSVYALDDVTPQQLRDAADQRQRNMELALVGATLAYGLQIVDATVDAHLSTFDVTEDLSMHIAPSFNLAYNQRPVHGLSIQLTF